MYPEDKVIPHCDPSAVRQQLLFDVARVFKRAGHADRCWLAARVKEAQERIHNKAKKDLVDQALEIVGA